MPALPYNVVPKAGGGFTTRVALENEIDVASLDAAVAAATGVPVAQCPAVLQEYVRRLMVEAGSGGWVRDLHGVLGARPTCGGSSPLPTGFNTVEDLDPDVSLTIARDLILQWQSTLTLNKVGEQGLVTPVIETVIRQSDMQQDRYTAGGLIEVRGSNLKLDTTDPTQGIFFKPAATAEVRAAAYAGVLPQSLIVLVPTGLTGSVTVRVAAYVSSGVRSYTYNTPVIP